MQAWLVVTTALLYVLALFVVAWVGDRRGRRSGRARPAIYTLSLAIYCTSWTFYGSVGLAATSGLDFLGIYLGPILAITVGFPLYRRMVRVAKTQRITSIADFLAARYGKSALVGAIASLIAIVGTVPYVALQLKAITDSVATMNAYYLPQGSATGALADASLYVASLLALFAVLFGTRHADATEHQNGMMLAIAAESIVKLLAFLLVGSFVCFVMFAGPGDIVRKASAAGMVWTVNWPTFLLFTGLSFLAFLLLPRQFHVGVVENRNEGEIRTARWGFPIYLLLINLFVLPVAAAGLATFGANVKPDVFMLALPLSEGAAWVAGVGFVGGLSAATAMAIVASVALAVMVSNNVVLPLVLRRDARIHRPRGERRVLVLGIRRAAIAATFTLAFLYYQAAGASAALASIGLLAFAAIAQLGPAFVAALFWRRATSRGAAWGMTSGILVWAYTLFLPTLVDSSSPLLASGPFGVEALRPQHLLGTDWSPLLAGVVFSLGVNTVALAVGSLTRPSRPLERIQAHVFAPLEADDGMPPPSDAPDISRRELEVMASRYLGRERTRRSFDAYLTERGLELAHDGPADRDLLRFSESLLASAIGAASASLVVSLILQRHSDTSDTTRQLLDDARDAVLENRDLLQTAIDQVDQGISVFDADYRLNSWNRRFRQLFDFPEDLARIGTPLDRIAQSIAQRCDGELDLTRAIVERRSDLAIRHDTGRDFDIVTRALPDGGLVVTWSDVTQRVTAQNILEKARDDLERSVEERTAELTRLAHDLATAREVADAANRSKTQFLAAAGHDILQPLNAARLYATSLMERGGDGETGRLADRVHRSLASVEEILGAVIEISKLDTGALPPRRRPVAVDDIFERLSVEFEPLAREKGLELVFEQHHAAVHTDPALFSRLMQNLVQNAIRYTEEGTVRVAARVEDATVVFTVSDTGVGIDLADRERIFAEFTRLEAGRRAAQGLGLGLSIVRRIAETLDHDVSLDSSPSGTTFAVRTPLSAREAVSATKAATAGSPRHLRLAFACIDNDDEILDGMRTLLLGWGATSVTVGADAAALRDERIDVVLADYHLDGTNGLAEIAALRSRYGNIPAALLTAERSPALREKARGSAVSVLYKPIKPARLRAFLAAARSRASEPAL